MFQLTTLMFSLHKTQVDIKPGSLQKETTENTTNLITTLLEFLRTRQKRRKPQRLISSLKLTEETSTNLSQRAKKQLAQVRFGKTQLTTSLLPLPQTPCLQQLKEIMMTQQQTPEGHRNSGRQQQETGLIATQS